MTTITITTTITYPDKANTTITITITITYPDKAITTITITTIIITILPSYLHSYSFLFISIDLLIPFYSFLITFLFFLFLLIDLLMPSYSFLFTFLIILIPFY